MVRLLLYLLVLSRILLVIMFSFCWVLFCMLLVLVELSMLVRAFLLMLCEIVL